MRLRIPLAGAVILLVGLLMPRLAEAGPIAGGQLFATGGDVTATYLGHSANFTSDLHVFAASDLSTSLMGPIFNNKTTPVGATADLGSFEAGTELVFGIYVYDTGLWFYSGLAARNQDGVAHAAVDNGLPPAFLGYGPEGSLGVGFEDLFGGGDLDYNDCAVAFSNIRAGAPLGTAALLETPAPVPAPEPGTLLLLGSGLTGGLYRRLRRKKATD